MSEELKPCPFCGSTNIGYATLSHVCLECGAMAGPILVNKETQEGWEKLDAAWNTRAAETEYVRKDISDELAKALERIEKCMRVNYGRQNEKIADITQLATAALAKYGETET